MPMCPAASIIRECEAEVKAMNAQPAEDYNDDEHYTLT